MQYKSATDLVSGHSRSTCDIHWATFSGFYAYNISK